MKSVLISIQPKWCELIASGKKTVEVRKTAPKEVPFKVYIYQTKESKRRFLDHRFNSFFAGTSHYKDMGKVIGEFICDRIEKFSVFENDTVQNWNYAELCNSCLSYDEVSSYIGKDKIGYAWHISELKIYDKPRELGEFLTPSGTGGVWGNHYLSRPPQSWCYVEN